MTKTALTLGLACICTVFNHSTSAQEAETMTKENCHLFVEDYFIMLEADVELPKEDDTIVRNNLKQAVDECKAGNVSAVESLLIVAGNHYDDTRAKMDGSLTSTEFWQIASHHWGGSGTYRQGIQTRRANINCDDKQDMFGWRLDLDNPDNPGLRVIAVVKNDDGSIQSATYKFPLDESQYSICYSEDYPMEPDIHLDERVEAEFAAELGAEACPQILRIDDGMCDNIRLMWPKAAHGTEVEFIMHRN